MRLTRSLLVVLRALALLLVVIGVGFWTGHWFGLRPVHMALGPLFVLVLWSLAVVALRSRRATGLAVFALVWGVVIAAFGASQQGLLIGDHHWIVRVTHLALAMAAMPVAERLVRSTA